MKRFFYIAILLTLLCCGKHPGEIHLHGDFAHLEQGEFYIYGTQGMEGSIDTLHIIDGEFEYSTKLEDRAVLHILYPNYSTLTVFAYNGDDIDIKGDARSLNAVKVSGNEDNELYSSFRKDTEGSSGKECTATAHRYILEHPHTLLAKYLFAEYMIGADSVTHKEVAEVYDSLCKACPEDAWLSRMATKVKASGVLKKGGTLPAFRLAMRPSQFTKNATPDTVDSKDLKGDWLLISFWASWRSGSQSALFRSRKSIREMKEKGKTLQAISYSLDVSDKSLRRVEKADSVDFHSYCDFKCFDSELAKRWGITRLPFFILVSPDMKIEALGGDWKKDIDPKYQELCL